jgi:hypothetical protein
MEHRDSCTGLFPWQLAAVKANQPQTGRDDETTEQLDTIHNLLRLFPESITCTVRMMGTIE